MHSIKAHRQGYGGRVRKLDPAVRKTGCLPDSGPGQEIRAGLELVTATGSNRKGYPRRSRRVGFCNHTKETRHNKTHFVRGSALKTLRVIGRDHEVICPAVSQTTDSPGRV